MSLSVINRILEKPVYPAEGIIHHY